MDNTAKKGRRKSESVLDAWSFGRSLTEELPAALKGSFLPRQLGHPSIAARWSPSFQLICIWNLFNDHVQHAAVRPEFGSQTPGKDLNTQRLQMFSGGFFLSWGADERHPIFRGFGLLWCAGIRLSMQTYTWSYNICYKSYIIQKQQWHRNIMKRQ